MTKTSGQSLAFDLVDPRQEGIKKALGKERLVFLQRTWWTRRGLILEEGIGDGRAVSVGKSVIGHPNALSTGFWLDGPVLSYTYHLDIDLRKLLSL